MSTIDRSEIKLYYENGLPFLCIRYREEDDREVKLHTFPKVELPITKTILPKVVHYPEDITKAYFNGGMTAELYKTSVDPIGDVYYYSEILETKTHEMTLDEIEKKLGYKVKIVNK